MIMLLGILQIVAAQTPDTLYGRALEARAQLRETCGAKRVALD